jgi:hypothetical protein
MFGMMHWRYGGLGKSLEEKINKEDSTTESVLDETGLKQALSCGNDKLNDFFTPKRIKELIAYATTMPADSQDRAHAYRYPFVSMEILKSKSPFITNYFFPLSAEKKEINEDTKNSSNADLMDMDIDKELLELQKNIAGSSSSHTVQRTYNKETLDSLVINFLNSNECRDPVLSGYFMQIFSSLLDHHQNQMCQYVFDNPEIIALLIDNIDVSALATVLRMIINVRIEEINEYEDTLDGDTPHPASGSSSLDTSLHIAHRQAVYSTLFSLYTSTDSEDTMISVLSILSHLANNIVTVHAGNRLIDGILDSGVLPRLVERLDGPHAKITADMLIEIVTLFNPDKKIQGSNELLAGISSLSGLTKAAYVKGCNDRRSRYLMNDDNIGSVKVTLAGLFKKIKNKIEGMKVQMVCTSSGVETMHLGTEYLSLVSLAFNIITLDIPYLHLCLSTSRSNLIPSLLSLSLKAVYNTFYHNILFSIIRKCLDVVTSPLFNILADGHTLLIWMQDGYKLASGKYKGQLCGFIGGMNALGTTIAKFSADKRDALGKDRWADIVSQYLSPVLAIEDTDRNDVFKRAFKQDKDITLDIDSVLFLGAKSFKGRRGGQGFGGVETRVPAKEETVTEEEVEDAEDNGEQEGVQEGVQAKKADNFNVDRDDDYANSDERKEYLSDEKEDDHRYEKKIEVEIISKEKGKIRIDRLSNDLDAGDGEEKKGEEGEKKGDSDRVDGEKKEEDDQEEDKVKYEEQE